MLRSPWQHSRPTIIGLGVHPHTEIHPRFHRHAYFIFLFYPTLSLNTVQSLLVLSITFKRLQITHSGIQTYKKQRVDVVLL